MTELPTLQAALRETAERTYPRRRRPLLPALLVAAAATAAVLVIRDRDTERPAREVAATPAPTMTPTVAFSTPAPETGPARLPPTPTAKLQKAERVNPDDPALKALLNPDSEIVRAWSVPEFKGHVILSRRGTDWCLSVPDPASDQPDIERGMTCAPDARFQSRGIETNIGGNEAEVAPTHPGTAEATGPDGKTRTVKVHGGELVLVHGMLGVDYRLSQFEPGIK
jgi:hypothetical protein